jgi:hypothetical protein
LARTTVYKLDMIDHPRVRTHYSAPVALFLEAAGGSYPLAKVGPTYVVLRSPADIPSRIGSARVVVDGIERVWPVRVGGTVPFEEDTTVAVCDYSQS